MGGTLSRVRALRPAWGPGPPDDTRSDIKTPIWAGVVPLKLTAGKPDAAPDMVPGIPLPDYLKNPD
jgi:hypothetical protein